MQRKKEEIRPKSKYYLYCNMFAVSKMISSARIMSRCGRMCYSSTSALFERFTIPVPPMGESIKSGKISTCSYYFRHSCSMGKEPRRLC